MKIYMQTNKATTNIFGPHTQPRKSTRYTNILKLVWGGGGGEEKELILNLRGKRAPKKAFLRSKFSKKCPKRFFWSFFWKICLWRRKCGQNRFFIVIWGSSENKFGRTIKKIEKLFEIVLNICPLEKILDPLIQVAYV